MMQQALVQPGAVQTTVVFGIDVVDPALASKVKAVVVVSIILALWNIGVGVVSIASGGIMTLACALCVPACGYFGAKQKNRELLCAFWGCNGCAMVCNACAIVVLLLVGAGLAAVAKVGDVAQVKDCCTTLGDCQFAPTDCECRVPAHDNLTDMVYYPQGNDNCPTQGAGANATEHTFCLDQQACDFLGKAPKEIGLLLGGGAFILLLPCVLATIGCVCGYQLYSHPTFGRPVVVQTQYPVAAATVVTAPQPPPMAPMK